MSNPVGLMRLEEAYQLYVGSGLPIIDAAQPGIRVCRVVVRTNGEACGAVATCRIVWHDGDKTAACAECAQQIDRLAQSRYHTNIRIEPLQ